MEIKRTISYMCMQQCGLLVHLDDDGKVVKAEGDPSALVGDGYTCERVNAIPEFHYHPQWLNYPLKRAGERGQAKWKRISWDQAMDEIAEKLIQIKKEYGPEAIAKIGCTVHGPADWTCWRFLNCGVRQMSSTRGRTVERRTT